MATMKMPTLARKGKRGTAPTISEVEGNRVHFTIGDKRVAFFIHGDTLSHWASGYRVGSLNTIKVRNMCHLGHHARLTDREAAQILISDIVAQHGAQAILAKFAAVPTINA